MTLSAVAWMGSGSAAMAAGSAADTANDGNAVEQVTVTGIRPGEDINVATKSSVPLIVTPQSIQVIGAATVDLQGAQSLGEALRYSAGVNPEQYGGVDQRIDWYMIRGFQTSAPYIDGLTSNSRYTLMALKVDPWGLEQIEVLRGPSSVLYGQNVPGGLVNVVSRRPQQTAGGEVDIQTGSYGRIEGRVDLTGPVTTDGALLYRFTASALSTGTQVEHVDNHHYFIAPALTWKPDANTSITLLSHYERQNDGFALQNLPAAGTLYPSSLGVVPTSQFTGEPSLNFATLTQTDVGYNAEHRLSDTWTVRQNLRYTHSQVGLGYVAGYGQEDDDPALMNRFALKAHAHQNNFAVDTSVEGHLQTGALEHTLLVGVDYSRSHDLWTEEDGGAAQLDITHPVYGGPIDLMLDYVTDDWVQQTGIYVQDTIKVDRLVLTGSIRRDWADTRTVDVLYGPDLKQHDTALTGRGGAVYLFDNGLAPYVSYSTSFQPTVGATYTGGDLLKPTTARQWEVGVKYQPKRARGSITLSAYDIQERNITTADTTNLNHPNAVVQTGAARVRGIELSGDLNLGHGVFATANYAYMASEITAANPTDGVSTVGNQLQDVARNSAGIWLNKAFAVGPEQTLTLGGGLRYIGSRYGDDLNTLLLPSNTQLDALVRYQLRHWMVSVNVRNLTDERVVATCDSTARCFYGERRSVLATFGYRW